MGAQNPYGQPPYGGPPGGPPSYGGPQGPSGPYGPTGTGRGTNGLAVASLVSGILWLCGVGSIAAVVLGHIALSQIKRTGAAGRGLAIAGLVLGYLGVAGGVITLLAILGAANNDDTGTSGGSPEQARPAYSSPGSGTPSRPGAIAKVTIETCELDEILGIPGASGVLSNLTGREASFRLHMRFSRADGTILGTGETFVEDVPAGGQKKYEVSDLGVTEETGRIKCQYRVEER